MGGQGIHQSQDAALKTSSPGHQGVSDDVETPRQRREEAEEGEAGAQRHKEVCRIDTDQEGEGAGGKACKKQKGPKLGGNAFCGGSPELRLACCLGKPCMAALSC